MSELTLVSAFFDIGRGSYTDTVWTRTNEQYLDYFKFWAGIKNFLVVYTQPKFEKKILSIRAEYGLKEKTKVVVVDDFYSIEPDLYRRMKNVSGIRQFHNTRFYPNSMATRADYDYVMLMKYWCLLDAVQNRYAGGMLAWLDFGFNHGGVCYPYSEDFDFTWNYDFTQKIHLFTLTDPDSICAFEEAQLQFDCIMGCLIVLPEQLCGPLWKLMRKATEALLMLDSIDDDQMLLMMAYKDMPDLFEIHRSGWFLPLKENGGGHMRTITKCATASHRVDIFRLLRRIKNLRKVGTPYNFARRMYHMSRQRYSN